MTSPLPFFLIGLLLTACHKERLVDACKEKRPTETVIWLKQKVADLEKSPYCHAIRQFDFHGRKVFVVGTCEPNFHSVDQIYDCKGNLVCGWGDPHCPDFATQARFEKSIWRSH
jgi:hypothetical protein